MLEDQEKKVRFFFKVPENFAREASRKSGNDFEPGEGDIWWRIITGMKKP